jgi:hypothetical protein
MIQKIEMSNKYGILYKKPNILEFVSVFFFLMSIISLIFLKNHFEESEVLKKIEAYLFIFAWFILLITPIVERLRNIYILISWFIFCLLWFFYKFEFDFITAILPIIVLFYSQLSRFVFKKIFGYFPIHMIYNQWATVKYSKIENRKSTRIDYLYSVIYTVLGLILTISITLLNGK